MRSPAVKKTFVHRLLPACGEAFHDTECRTQPARVGNVVGGEVKGSGFHANGYARSGFADHASLMAVAVRRQ